MSKAIKIGDKVRYISKDHARKPEFYPEVGTVGTVKCIDESGDIWVQWTKGSTSGNDCWCCYESDIELANKENAKENFEMTNEEIWQMLEPKLVKNGLNWIHCGYDADGNKFYYFDKTALMNAVATAYKNGYYRSQKGRPFKFGEKKEKKHGGHWEPVAPENLPKEGTKVRYARHIDDNNKLSFSNWTGIKIGEETIVRRSHGVEFWVEDIHDKNNGYPVCSYLHPERFDMWVEDDE